MKKTAIWMKKIANRLCHNITKGANAVLKDKRQRKLGLSPGRKAGKSA
jgi:hypothetical protein